MSDPTPLVVGVLAVVVGPDLHAPPRETAIHGVGDPARCASRRGRFVVPFRDDTTAEEVGRLVTGQVRRERAAGEGA